jgi:hypothetical protein
MLPGNFIRQGEDRRKLTLGLVKSEQTLPEVLLGSKIGKYTLESLDKYRFEGRTFVLVSWGIRDVWIKEKLILWTYLNAQLKRDTPKQDLTSKQILSYAKRRVARIIQEEESLVLPAWKLNRPAFAKYLLTLAGFAPKAVMKLLDPSKGYVPGNIYFVSKLEQNQARVVYVEYRGERMSFRDFVSSHTKLKINYARQLLSLGRSLEELATYQPRKHVRKKDKLDAYA